MFKKGHSQCTDCCGLCGEAIEYDIYKTLKCRERSKILEENTCVFPFVCCQVLIVTRRRSIMHLCSGVCSVILTGSQSNFKQAGKCFCFKRRNII